MKIRRKRNERGAILVELTIVVPLLMTLILGAAETGLTWKLGVQVASAARSGARTGAKMGASQYADHDILVSVASGLSNVSLTDVELVVIYNASAPDGDVPPACLTPTATSAGGDPASECNDNTNADLAAIAANPEATLADFSDPTCSGQKDRFWCPASRQFQQTTTGGLDSVGVYIRTVTTNNNLILKHIKVADHGVMKIEPEAGPTDATDSEPRHGHRYGNSDLGEWDDQ
jgi:hypothetical protein